MYYLLGDFVRLGDTLRDPSHSTVVMVQSRLIISMNRNKRKLRMHIWEYTVSQFGEKPPILQPITSVDFEDLKREFIRNETR
jgi:hypothetical protein